MTVVSMAYGRGSYSDKVVLGACMFGSIDFLLHLKMKDVNFGSLQQSIDQRF